MKAIIIAAGPSKRLRPLTDDTPKCMLEIDGKPIIRNTIDIFRDNGINDISTVVGYRKEKINFDNISYFENTDFNNNNILHSLMFARSKMEEAVKTGEDVIITYSDIWYNEGVVKKLLSSSGDISAVVDIEWHEYYDGRTDHPIHEAENVILDDKSAVLKIGKHIFTSHIPSTKEGEFIGLWKFTSRGAEAFLKTFDRLDKSLKKDEPFQRASQWQKAYITDIFQEMVDKGGKIYGVLIKQNWKEFDTVQDYMRIKDSCNVN
ncbi:MAG: phosphocholine cytidylyltransferase family protein [Armatimonadota bacterium]